MPRMIDIKRILCPIDFSEFSRHAIDHAAAIAHRYQSRLTALHVFAHWPAIDVIPSLGPGALPVGTLNDAGRTALLTALRKFVGPASRGITLEPVVTEAPDISREILGYAKALNADLLVIGSHGRSGFERLLLGSVTEKVIRKASCPVMVVPSRAPDVAADAPIRFNRILCPVDGSAASARALAYALHLAEDAVAQVYVLHILEMPPELQEIPGSVDLSFDGLREAAKAEWTRRLTTMIPPAVSTQCAVDTAVMEGRAHREIVRIAAERRVDLIVMGAQGRHAIERWPFGSNTQYVLRAAACPVLTVRDTCDSK